VIGCKKTSLGEPLASLYDYDEKPEPEMASSSAATNQDEVLLLAPSSDIHDLTVIVQLTHGNITALWTQLRYMSRT